MMLFGTHLGSPCFRKDVIHLLQGFISDNIIFRGDFNFVFNLDFDKQFGNRSTHYKAREEFLNVMHHID